MAGIVPLSKTPHILWVQPNSIGRQSAEPIRNNTDITKCDACHSHVARSLIRSDFAVSVTGADEGKAPWEMTPAKAEGASRAEERKSFLFLTYHYTLNVSFSFFFSLSRFSHLSSLISSSCLSPRALRSSRTYDTLRLGLGITHFLDSSLPEPPDELV